MAKIKFEDLILYEDEHYIIINKPPFVSALDERTLLENPVSILSLAKKYHPDAQMCHRLDKETSGCMAIAKHPEAYRHLAMAFERRKVNKVYHAIAGGLHDFKALEVNYPILKLSKKGLVTVSQKEGKPATTIFNTLRFFKEHTLVECRPLTGRMHQIRIHLASQKASIAGDLAYHGAHIYLSQVKRKYRPAKEEDEQPITKRVALHAFALGFVSLDEKELFIEAPYPKDFAVLVKQLEKFA